MENQRAAFASVQRRLFDRKTIITYLTENNLVKNCNIDP